MLREVGKIYARAFRMIFKHPQFLRLSVTYYLFNFVFRFVIAALKKVIPLWGIILVDWISLGINFALLAGIPLALILMVYHSETGINPKEIFQKTREYFWKFVRQSLAGFLLSLAYTLPIFCLVLFSVFMDNALFITIIIPFWLLVNGFLSFGSISLGQRILLDKGEGAFQNSLKGLRILNGNFAFFASLYFLYTLISTAHLSSGFLLGSAITGVDLFAVPITSFSLFMKNIFAATQIPLVIGWNIILGTILYPFYIIVPTLAYLRFKSYKVLPRIIPRKLSTEN